MALMDKIDLIIHADNDVLDNSGNGNNGTVTGAIFDADIKKLGSHSLRYDHLDDKTVIANEGNFDYTTAMTLSCWAYSNFNDGIMMSKSTGGLGYELLNNGGGNVLGSLFLSGGLIQPSAPITLSEWTFWVLIWDGSFGKLYKDNILRSKVAGSGTLTTNAFGLTLGARASGGFSFGGNLDEHNVWPRALSDGDVNIGESAGGEIAQLWNDGLGLEAGAMTVTSPLGNRDSDSSIVFNDSISGDKRNISDSSNVLLHSVTLLNATGDEAYLQFFDVGSTGDVIVGTTAPTFVIGLEAQKQIHRKLKKPIRFFNGMFVASTTTRDGSTGAIQEVTLTYNDG